MLTGVRFHCQRKLQAFVVGAHIFLLVHARCIFLVLISYFLIFGGFSRFLVCAYFIYMLYDYNTPYQGGRRWNWLRKSAYFNLFAQYFPINIIQTEELDKNKNYLGIYHPHGVLFLANSATLAGDGLGLETRTGLNVSSTTLNFNFIAPLVREYYLAMGYISVSEVSLKNVLLAPEKGNLVVILAGGATEAGLAEPGKYHILLKRRRGFCRVAFETGSYLLPILVFGEVDCFDITHYRADGVFHKFRKLFQDLTGVNLIIYGNKDKIFPHLSLPRRSPINIIIGKPIPVIQNSHPTFEDISSLQQQYIESLHSLFEEHKRKFVKDPSCRLIIE